MKGMCEFKIVSTRWRDNSFDRIACDLRSRSLKKSQVCSHQVAVCRPFCRDRFHSELAQCTEHQKCILDEKVVGRQLVWQ